MGGSLRGVGVAVTGLVIGVLAAASIPLVSWIIHKEVAKRVIIKNTTDSELFPIWANPSLLPDLYLQIYPWNVKNPSDVERGEKAILEQKGPYTYREYRRKENIVFNDNGTVSYIERKWYKFDRNLSVGWDNETFTTLNIPLVALANLVRFNSGTYQWLISHIIEAFPSEKLFVTKTVHDMVFGYQDEMLKLAKMLRPSQFYTDVCGILAGKNYSYDGEFTIFTGESDINQLGKIDKFNGSSYLNFWTTEYANMINGSADGSVFPPFISQDFVATMFSMDVCRSATATFHGEETISKYNVKVRKFKAPKEELEKPSLNPDNAGFCTPYGNCLGSGLLNITTCQKIDGFHVPIIISFPHFYMAEDQYINGVIGMHPTSDLAIEVALEPTTGLVMQAEKKIQMNLYLQNSTSFVKLKNVRNTVFPILWVNESITIDDKHAALVKHELLIPQMAAQIVQYIVIAVGAFLFILGTFLVARSGIKQRSAQSHESSQESDGQIQHPTATSLPASFGAMNGAAATGGNAAGDAAGDAAGGTNKDTPPGDENGAEGEDQPESEISEVGIVYPKAEGDNAAEETTDNDTQDGMDDKAPLLST